MVSSLLASEPSMTPQSAVTGIQGLVKLTFTGDHSARVQLQHVRLGEMQGQLERGQQQVRIFWVLTHFDSNHLNGFELKNCWFFDSKNFVWNTFNSKFNHFNHRLKNINDLNFNHPQFSDDPIRNVRKASIARGNQGSIGTTIPNPIGRWCRPTFELPRWTRNFLDQEHQACRRQHAPSKSRNFNEIANFFSLFSWTWSATTSKDWRCKAVNQRKRRKDANPAFSPSQKWVFFFIFSAKIIYFIT